MMPRVSVIVPTYNALPWLEETLDSIRLQTYPPDRLELLVVDDGSTDDSALAARDFFRSNAVRGEVISLDSNSGPSAARNTGWKRASGDWIQFLDADDTISPEKISTQAKVAARAPAETSVIYSPWCRVEMLDGRWQRLEPLVVSSIGSDPVLDILADHDFGFLGPVLIRAHELRNVGGFNERLWLGEDIDLLLRIAMSGARFQEAIGSDPLFFYRQGHESLGKTGTWNPDRSLDALHVFRQVEMFLRDQCSEWPSEPARHALARRYALYLDTLHKGDQEAFLHAVEWIRDLGFKVPPGLNRRLLLASQILGTPKAYNLRSAVRRLKRRSRQ